MTGIYIHIPFCARKCPYCDFFSVRFQKDTVQNYVNAVIRNLKAYSESSTDKIDTIYFGGGTPSLLSAGQISDILEVCHKHYQLSCPEITLELNPSRNQESYLHDLHSAGINRLSIGTQSFSDAQLKLLGRTHKVRENLKSINSAVQAGFENISCDVMLALPYQTEEILSETLAILTSQPITHVSAYLLQLEEGTPFSQNPEILAHLPDDDTSADRYLQTVHALENAGFHQYEVSSFAKSGFESRHNLKYWLCENYIGIGAGAHSCLYHRRFYAEKDITAFCASSVQKEILISDNACDGEERLMLALRTVTGIPESAISTRAKKHLNPLLKSRYIQINPDGNIALTPEGFAVSNAVIAMLLE